MKNNDYRDNTVFDIKKRKKHKMGRTDKRYNFAGEQVQTNKKIRLKNITK